MIKEVLIKDPITYEGQPDGGRTPMIDPYDGCQLCCPYCFQQNDINWNKNIYVNINIAELLNERLENWSKNETIYLGSKCDPYMELEKKYGLTKKCLSALNELKIDVMITTKSDNDLIFRDLDIIKNYQAQLTILMGITNMNQIGKRSQNKNIINANKLFNEGVNVWVFITPILPYIMDVEEIISALNPNIPIYLDKLRVENNIQINNIMEYIKRSYPEYTQKYNEIINGNNDEYFNEIKKQYINNERIKILFI
jgi:DNA repair photolyase